MKPILQKYKQVSLAFVLSVFFYGVHKLLIIKNILNIPTYFSIEIMHLIFSVSSILIVLILSIIYYKKPDNVGYSFMGITIFKMIALLAVFKNIIQQNSENINPEKTTIIILFLIYLALETILMAQLLNKNYQK